MLLKIIELRDQMSKGLSPVPQELDEDEEGKS